MAAKQDWVHEYTTKEKMVRRNVERKVFLSFSYSFEVLCEANVMGTHHRNFHVLHGDNGGDDE